MLEVDFLYSLTLSKDGSTMVRTNVEQHLLGTIILVIVAVDAMIIFVIECPVILIDHFFLEVREVTLI